MYFIVAQSNGDVFLTNSSTNNGVKEGLLQIYLDNSSGLVCYDGFNMYAAHAACRELGFIEAKGFGKASENDRYPI